MQIPLAMVAMVAIWALGSGRAVAAPLTPNMTISGPGGTVAVGGDFEVSISIDSGTVLFDWYQVEVDVPAGLGFVSGTHEGPFPSCFLWEANPDHPTWHYTACGHPTATFKGLVETITLRCDVPGTYPLNLVDATEDADNGSTLGLINDGPITTNVTPDGEQTVTCGGSGPVGGIAELPAVEPEAAAAEAGSSTSDPLAVAGLAAGGALLVSAGMWYARRRWLS